MTPISHVMGLTKLISTKSIMLRTPRVFVHEKRPVGSSEGNPDYGVKNLEELRRRAREEGGKGGSSGNVTDGIRRRQRNQVQRGDKPDKEDRQHGGQGAGFCAVPVGSSAVSTEQALNPNRSGWLVGRVRRQEFDHRGRIGAGTLGARLHLRGNGDGKGGDGQPDPRSPVSGCHIWLPSHIVPQIVFSVPVRGS